MLGGGELSIAKEFFWGEVGYKSAQPWGQQYYCLALQPRVF